MRGFIHLPPYLIAGRCKHEKEDGSTCNEEFTGPRSQKYCKEHSIQNNINRDRMAEKRASSRKRREKKKAASNRV